MCASPICSSMLSGVLFNQWNKNIKLYLVIVLICTIITKLPTEELVCFHFLAVSCSVHHL
jgi:hypothetical protein